MRRSAAVLCRDTACLQTLKESLESEGFEPVPCHSADEAMERVMTEGCATLIVDFDLPGARDLVKMAGLLSPSQKPALLAVAARAWPGTGAEVSQSGAEHVLYKPLQMAEVKLALEAEAKRHDPNRRRGPRHEMKTVVHLEIETGTVPALGIDISEHGFAVQAPEPVPMRSNLRFRCTLPGTDYELHGHADVIWASDQGRAGLFFSKLSLPARKRLKQWLAKRGRQAKGKDAMRALRPPVEAVCEAMAE